MAQRRASRLVGPQSVEVPPAIESWFCGGRPETLKFASRNEARDMATFLWSWQHIEVRIHCGLQTACGPGIRPIWTGAMSNK